MRMVLIALNMMISHYLTISIRKMMKVIHIVKGMVICYLCSSITQFCIYKTSKRNRENVKGKYTDLESGVDHVNDGQRLRGSA